MIVALGACLFGRGHLAGIVAPSDKDAYEYFTENVHTAPTYYPQFSAVVYSLDTFLPVINLGQKDHWAPNANLGKDARWLRRYLWAHIISGWILTTLFLAGVAGVTSRHP
jgi:hypothetical protein